MVDLEGLYYCKKIFKNTAEIALARRAQKWHF